MTVVAVLSGISIPGVSGGLISNIGIILSGEKSKLYQLSLRDPGNGNTAQNCNNHHSLSTFVNVSNAPTPPFSMIVTSNTLQPLSNNEPEPYATTDILRAEKEKLQQNHYAVNIYAFYFLLVSIQGVSWDIYVFYQSVCSRFTVVMK